MGRDGRQVKWKPIFSPTKTWPYTPRSPSTFRQGGWLETYSLLDRSGTAQHTRLFELEKSSEIPIREMKRKQMQKRKLQTENCFRKEAKPPLCCDVIVLLRKERSSTFK